MSRTPRSPRPWNWALTLRLTWCRSWTSWRLARSTKRLAREVRREQLLLRSLDSSRLRQKELETQHHLLVTRLREMQESREHRELALLPPVTSSTPDLDRALGLSTPTP